MDGAHVAVGTGWCCRHGAGTGDTGGAAGGSVLSGATSNCMEVWVVVQMVLVVQVVQVGAVSLVVVLVIQVVQLVSFFGSMDGGGTCLIVAISHIAVYF